jgi:predicted nuclease of predicted toxin-antitoxin system
LQREKPTAVSKIESCSSPKATLSMTKIRFQADADLRHAIVTGVKRRQANLDFQSANVAGLGGIKDPEVLAIAARDNRILVTHDRKTMPAEFGQFILSNSSSGVLILSQNLPINEAIEAIILVWEASTAEEWINQIMTFPF